MSYFFRTSKDLYPGHYLSGTISYTKDEKGKKADVYPFKYVLPEPSKKNLTSDDSKNIDKEKTKYNEYKRCLRDLKINWLGKVGE